jgi:hypothetical protein
LGLVVLVALVVRIMEQLAVIQFLELSHQMVVVVVELTAQLD